MHDARMMQRQMHDCQPTPPRRNRLWSPCALLLRGAPMGWEWRCFVPLPTHVSAAVEGPVEERTDEYLLIESEAVGVSARLPLLLLLHT
jgi:hypothetical protein